MPHIKKNIAIVVLSFFLLSANLYTLLFTDSLFEGVIDRLWYVLVIAIGWGTGLFILKLRTFFIVAGAAQMLVWPIEVSSLYLNGQPVSMPFMYWIISTNSKETQELLASVWWLVLVVFFVWGLYVWLVTCIPAETKLKIRKWWFSWSILVGMIMALLSVHFIQLNKNYTAPNKRVYAQIYAWSLGMRVGNVFPYDIYLQTYRAHKHLKEIDGITALSDFQFGITPRSDTDSALYVLVIGEAARYQNFSLNGEYKRETNPLLASQSNLVFYTRACAEANATDFSIPLMITRATADNPLIAYKEKTVAGAFQEAGYKAAWLSTKPFPIRYLQHVLPSLDTIWIASKDVIDEAIFDPFRNLLYDASENSTNGLIVLHTQGSHLNYQDRYPENFAKFEPYLKQGATNGTFDKELMTNTYDNSILYTDYILHSLIQMLDSTHRCACLIYMPDHGENLCDDERKLWVHGSFEGSEWEFHVPLLVWYSDMFQKKYPHKVEALKANKGKQVTSQVLFYTLCDMANLQEVANPHYSLLSDSLEEVQTIKALNGKGELIEPF